MWLCAYLQQFLCSCFTLLPPLRRYYGMQVIWFESLSLFLIMWSCITTHNSCSMSHIRQVNHMYTIQRPSSLFFSISENVHIVLWVLGENLGREKKENMIKKMIYRMESKNKTENTFSCDKSSMSSSEISCKPCRIIVITCCTEVCMIRTVKK